MSSRIAIIGAGPIGLEAALYARALGHDVILLECHEIAANVASWQFVRLFSPWRMNVTPLGLSAANLAPSDLDMDECPTGRELRARYLLPLAESSALKGCIRTNTSVVAVGRDQFSKSDEIGKPARASSPFRILVRDGDGREHIEHAQIVLDCSGTYACHRWAGRGGVPAPGETQNRKRIRYILPDILRRDRAAFADRHTLLLGAGYSAATALSALAELATESPRTRVTWAMRRPGPALHSVERDTLSHRQALVQRMLDLVQNPPNWLRILEGAHVDAIEHAGDSFQVTLSAPAGEISLTCDQFLALVGYAPDASLYEQLQIHQCYATAGPIKLAAALLGAASAGADCLTAGSALTPDSLKNPEPSFYILGAKSYGTNSHFLLQTGHQQIRDVFRLIEQNPTLDLYAAPSA